MIIKHKIISLETPDIDLHEVIKLFENTEWGISLLRPGSDHFENINPALAKMHGYTVTELIGKPVSILFPSTNTRSVKADVQLAAEKGKCVLETVHQRKDGSLFTVHVTLTPIISRKSEVIGVMANMYDITEHQELLNAVQSRDVFYKELFKNSISGIAYHKMFYEDGKPIDYQYLSTNPSFEALTGLDFVVGKRISEVLPGIRESDPELFEAYARVASTGIPEALVKYVPSLDRWFRISAYSPEKDHFVTIFDNITEEKKTEQIIQARIRLTEYAVNHSLSELQQKVIDEICDLTHSPIGFFHSVKDDQKTLELQAWSKGTLAGMCTAEGAGSHYPIDKAGVWVDCVRERRPIIHNDYATLAHRKGLPDGHAPIIREMVFPIFYQNSIVAIIGVGNKPSDYTQADIDHVGRLANLGWDITSRKKAEEQMLAINKNFEATLDAIPDLLFEFDLEGNCYAFHSSRLSARKIGAEEIVNKNLSQMLPPEAAATVQSALNEAHSDGYSAGKQFSLMRPSGLRHYEITVSRKAEDPPRFILLRRDVTSSVKAIKALEKAEEIAQLGRYSANFVQGTWGSSPILDEIFGIDNSFERNIENWLTLVHSDDRESMKDYLFTHVIKNQLPFDRKYPIQRANDGELRWVRGKGEMSFDSAGNPLKLVGTIQDITSSVIAEKKFQEAQKKEAAVVFAGGIAHDFNNILTVINGHGQMISLHAEKLNDVDKPIGEKIMSGAQTILNSVERAAKLVRQLLTITQPGREEKRETVHLNHMIHEIVDFLRPSIPRAIEIQQDLDMDLHPLFVDGSQIHQIIMNLSVNAWHAMRNIQTPGFQGTLRIKTQNVILSRAALKDYPDYEPGNYVLFSVKDNGSGIKPDVLNKIFDPFFTTKQPGEGTGLGLSVVKTLVEHYHGFMKIDTTENVGTEFKIYLPAKDRGNVEAIVEVTGNGQKRVGPAKILVVDDEPAILGIYKALLQHGGFTIIEASSADEAISIYKAQKQEIDLVVMDMNMPKKSGGEALRELKEFDPSVKVVISSGHSYEATFETLKDEGAVMVVQKPITNWPALYKQLNDLIEDEEEKH